jgi:hypothetical protein
MRNEVLNTHNTKGTKIYIHFIWSLVAGKRLKYKRLWTELQHSVPLLSLNLLFLSFLCVLCTRSCLLCSCPQASSRKKTNRLPMTLFLHYGGSAPKGVEITSSSSSSSSHQPSTFRPSGPLRPRASVLRVLPKRNSEHVARTGETTYRVNPCYQIHHHYLPHCVSIFCNKG